jgi:hypothetical protein
MDKVALGLNEVGAGVAAAAAAVGVVGVPPPAGVRMDDDD